LISPLSPSAWQYTGLNPEELEGPYHHRLRTHSHHHVDNIEHIESTTVNGQAIVKIFSSPTPAWKMPTRKSPQISQTILRQFHRARFSAHH